MIVKIRNTFFYRWRTFQIPERIYWGVSEPANEFAIKKVETVIFKTLPPNSFKWPR